MSNLNINVIHWNIAAQKLKAVNKTLHDLIKPICTHLTKSTLDYCYQMNFGFGELIIKDGQMLALEKDKNGAYLNESIVNVRPLGFTPNQVFDFKRFIQDCGQMLDHPLSIVTNNYIEIYCKKKSSLPTADEYEFPLSIVNVGDLFGVWGSIDAIFDVKQTDYYPWSAVAGKTCLLPLFPEPVQKKSSELYRNNFSDIFGPMPNAKEGIIHIANQISNSTEFAEIIILPKWFFTDVKTDDSTLKAQKARLREYLFKMAWEQTKPIRDMPWSDRKLIEKFEYGFSGVIDIKEQLFPFNFAKHLLSIVDGNSFVLKPVSIDDGLLYDVFLQLVSSFGNSTDKHSTLLDYSTPIFLHYEKLNHKNTKGIELAHAPSINMEFSKVRNDVMSKTIQAFIERDKMKKILKDKGYEVNLTYFKENGTKHAKDIGDYIDLELMPLYRSVLDDKYFRKLDALNKKVKLPKSPSLFNSFLQIERANW